MQLDRTFRIDELAAALNTPKRTIQAACVSCLGRTPGPLEATAAQGAAAQLAGGGVQRPECGRPDATAGLAGLRQHRRQLPALLRGNTEPDAV
jgi:hypothetical protein